MKIRGAIFDMDGTLIDSLMFWGCLWKKIGETYFGDPAFTPDEAVDRAVRTMIYTDAMRHVRTACGIDADEAEFLAFARSGLESFYRDTATVKPGAAALLSHLKAQGVTLCLASATALKEVRYALTVHGLMDSFTSVLSCADIGAGKDKPDIYLAAMAGMGYAPEEICVFEDSFVALETAKSIGMHTVGIFDRYNFGQDRLAAASEIYLGEGVPLDTLIPQIQGK